MEPWSGFYIGLLGGKTFATHEIHGDRGAYDESRLEYYKLKPKPFVGGLLLGYKMEFEQTILGIEADVLFGKKKDSFWHPNTAAPQYDNAGFVELGIHGTLTARLGYSFESITPYVKGGLAWAHVKMQTGDLDGAAYDPSDFTSKKGVRAGWTIGGGVEYAINERFSIRAEYMYMDLGKYTTTNRDRDQFRHKMDMHSVRIGITYNF